MLREENLTDKELNNIRERLKKAKLFLDRLSHEDYSIGRYLKKYDFDDTFLREETFMIYNSVKTVEAVENLSDFIKHKKYG